MSLGFSFGGGNGSGDFAPFVKYDARAGRWFRPDRMQDASGTWVTDQADITNSFCAVFDFENMEIGWCLFPTGAGPSFVMVRHGQLFPPKPADGAQWKQGVKLNIKLSPKCGDDVRQLSSSAAAFLTGLSELHDAYLAGKEVNRGKLPVVKMATTTPVTTGTKQKSTNYQPVFNIVGWIERPTDLVAQPAKPANGAPARTAPSTGSTVVAPPARRANQVMDDDIPFDFGVATAPQQVASADTENDFG